MAKKQRQKVAGKRSAERKNVPLNIRVTDPEKAAFQRAAEIAGVGVSTWMRERLRIAAMRELDNIGEVAPFFLALGATDNGNS
jgi:hypothetical protein